MGHRQVVDDQVDPLRSSCPRGQEREKGLDKYVFVEFNAWLYQGYDDARAALMDVIADKLANEAESRETALEKVAALAKRVKWLRVAKLATTSAASIYFGVPPVGAAGEFFELGRRCGARASGRAMPMRRRRPSAMPSRKAASF
ncbi:P-loop NTPase fold protein [Bradyrhizobium japonicum]